MDLKTYFEQIDLNEIDRFISEGQEENVNIEFKTVNHPELNAQDFDKKNISKTLSGFANSDGGIVVWGIKAKQNEKKQDIAKDKVPINKLTEFLNTLNRLEGQAVTPVVTGIQHKKIEIHEDCGFIITYVPASDLAPHIANYAGKHYYKRSGDSFYQCEHYDIKDMFQRKHTADLKLKFSDKQIRNINNDKIEVTLTLSVRNHGRNFAKAPFIKININQPYELHQYGLDGNGNIGTFRRRENSSPQSSTYSGEQDVIIYPGLDYHLDRIKLIVNKDIEQLPNLKFHYFIVAENMEYTTVDINYNVSKSNKSI